MMSELDNPFSVTKATEFSDEQIKEYWVNFNAKKDVSIESFLNPREFLPKYLIGGKGCGKTHILRYFSYALQKIRHNNNIKEVLINDNYLGLYSVISGLNSSRFDGKGISESEWQSVFEYYFELYMCDNLLATIQEIISMLQVDSSVEADLVKKILLIFSNYKEIQNVKSIHSLIEFLSELRRKIDSQVLNAAFTRKLIYEEVTVYFSPGDLLFGIPNCISKCIEEFREIKFIFMFDEYEKLYEWQKKFVNTLVWDKKMPVTFWIGARRYGYTTRETKSGQEMKSGSEFQDVNLDEIIRSNEDLYRQFAEQLYINRLTKYYESNGLKIKQDDLIKSFCARFEPYDDNKIIKQIVDKNRKKEYKHIRDLRNNLLLGIKLKKALNLPNNNNEEVDQIIEQIILNTNNNPLEQKYKIFFLYRLWSKGGKKVTFADILYQINTEFDLYKKNTSSLFDEIVDKRKKDFIAQLTKENDVKNTEYSGIGEFIKISQGNARCFILMLKKAIEFAKIRGEKPLEDGGTISLDSQYLAVYDTARWFYEDAELIGESGKNIYTCLRRLTECLMLERFCDKPVETTVSCFYLKEEDLSQQSLSCIEIMKLHSIIIEDNDGRLEKNSGRKERLFQINKVLAPLWNLPSVVRGSISLNKEYAESIFNYERKTEFDKLYKIRKGQLNAPEFRKPDTSKNDEDNSLFLI